MTQFYGLCIGGPDDAKMMTGDAPVINYVASCPEPTDPSSPGPIKTGVYRHYHVQFGDFGMGLWVPEPNGLAWAMQRVFASYVLKGQAGVPEGR